MKNEMSLPLAFAIVIGAIIVTLGPPIANGVIVWHFVAKFW